MSTSDRSHPPAPATDSPATGGEPDPRRPDEPSPPRPAGERVYDWVKERILDGRLPGGELLSEGDAATALNLSRTPVREAFLRLEVEGLLRLYPKRGALVVPVSPNEVDEVTEARILLESHAAERVIDRGDAAEVAARMRTVLDRQRELDVPDDRARFSALDREFHATLVDAAGNGLISHFYSGLHDRQVRMATSALRRVPDRRQEILAEHDRLCGLLEGGDAAGFRSTLTAHISGTHGALLDS
ncbi:MULTISPECIES: GntR family transcriptional regulator [Prauserella salsuginis group]|uniref:GntR family transcriptional regulator n=1 Tax=Prauserella salsuginis TaxID=387889 RepID=A0ABW6G6R4_9PSEU|nr:MULTISPECIES: GntR family transcriptional regulator [Prauserella salsuginis group]MCR3722685.1 DNA-binding transcriptional regulator, GntR family [Prauserella flava]MCR3737260.1 DNA-binding transcriptional regulator, GntR family [Prauserella salsuginis]